MILSSSVFREKIESGEKCQTIRPYDEKRFRMFENAKKYQLYWHNPRNGGKLIREVEPAGAPIRVFFRESVGGVPVQLWGSNHMEEEKLCDYARSTNEVAQRDGFKDFPELVGWFKEKVEAMNPPPGVVGAEPPQNPRHINAKCPYCGLKAGNKKGKIKLVAGPIHQSWHCRMCGKNWQTDEQTGEIIKDRRKVRKK